MKDKSLLMLTLIIKIKFEKVMIFNKVNNNVYSSGIENNNALQENRIDSRRSFGDDLSIQKSYKKKTNANHRGRN